MQDTMGFAVVGLAVIGSISVAVVVEWLSLWALMKMMPMPEPAAANAAPVGVATAPATPAAIPASAATSDASERAAAMSAAQ